MLYRYSLKERPSVYLLYRRCTDWVAFFVGGSEKDLNTSARERERVKRHRGGKSVDERVSK